MTKLAKTRVRARKGDQSWSLAISEDRQARRVMICTVSTLRPAYRTRCRGAVTECSAVCGYAGHSVETVQITTLRAGLSSDMVNDQL